jgi:hypothetical protein
MSEIKTVDEWELVVPDDDAELVAEFRRHGVRPGQRVRVAVVDRNGWRMPTSSCRPFLRASMGPPSWRGRSGEILRSEFGLDELD